MPYPDKYKDYKIHRKARESYCRDTPGWKYSPALLMDLTLQRTIGNQEVQRMFKQGEIMAKLFVSQPGDVYEQEADRVARQVVNIVDNDIQLQTGKTGIQKKGTSPGGESISSQTEAKINALKGSGQPLEPKIRDYFQPRFGVNLGDVRVHTDSNADRLARAVQARAFTLGNDVVFARGEYQPGTQEGKQLVAHELTHVLQQGGGGIQTKVFRLSDEQQKFIDEQFNLFMIEEEEPYIYVGPNDYPVRKTEEPVTEEMVQSAYAKIGVLLAVLDQIHINFNTLLDLTDRLDDLKLPEQEAGKAFVENFIFGVVDGMGAAVPESMELITVFISKAIQAVARGIQAYIVTYNENNAIIRDVYTIDSIVTMINNCKTQFENLDLEKLRQSPGFVRAIEQLPIQAPSRKAFTYAEPIIGQLYFFFLRSLIKSKGGCISYEFTTNSRVDTSKMNVEDTEHYKWTWKLHDNPLSNWLILPPEQLHVYPAPWPFDNWGNNYDYKYIVGRISRVPEGLIIYTLKKLEEFKIPKRLLFTKGSATDLPHHVFLTSYDPLSSYYQER